MEAVHMTRVIDFLQKRISFSLIFYLILIYVIMTSVLQGLELVVRGISTDILRLLIVLGILTGWLLGRSRMKAWKALVISIMMGFLFSTARVSGLDSAFVDLTRSAMRGIGSLLLQRADDGTNQLYFYQGIFRTRFSETVYNLTIWFNDLLSGFVVYNQISTLLSWGVILWVLSSWISWITRRKDQPIWGVIPAGTLLAILLTYTYQKRILLVILLGAGLILIGMINFDANLRKWKRARITGAENVQERMVLVVVGFSLYTMVFAGIVPSVRVNAIADPFEDWLYGEDETVSDDSESSIEGEGSINPNIYSGDQFSGLPRSKLIGSGPELAEIVVMTIGYPTISLEDEGLPNKARYWRSFSYDRYTGTGWRTSPTLEQNYRPGQEIMGLQNENQEVFIQEVSLEKTLRRTLFSAGSPLVIDQGARVFWRKSPNETSTAISSPPFEEDLFGVTLDDTVYQVRSQISTAGARELRSSGDSIPEWIRGRYLALPETVPARVHELAAEIIANQPTAYDQAKALETFLRSYPYNLDLPEPPLEGDVVDYFLFDLQTGYCDYYATSMVVLARSVGLPARIVIGYAGGQYDKENDLYLVSEADAHSWVEIYFSGFGWIPFEPTAVRSQFNEEELSLPLPPELEKLPKSSFGSINIDFPVKEVSLGLILSFILIIFIYDRVDQARMKNMDLCTLSLELYGRIYRYGRWLRIGHHKSDTIYEVKQKLVESLTRLAETSWDEDDFQLVMIWMDKLTEYAISANYSEKPHDFRQADDLLEIWKDLRSKLRFAIWLRQVKRAKLRLLNNKTEFRFSR
jgi:hypothetical protein